MKQCYCMGETEQTRLKSLDKKKCIFLENACRVNFAKLDRQFQL